jgi:hypothetical protein
MLELLWSLYRPAAAIIKEFLKRSVLHIGIVMIIKNQKQNGYKELKTE